MASSFINSMTSDKAIAIETLLLYQCILVALVFITFLLAIKAPQLLLLTITGGVVLTFIDSFSRYPEHSLIHWMGVIKIMLLLPFGLGIIVGFGLFDPIQQKKYLWIFRSYVNIAVIINIGVMVLTPTDETLRGISSKCVCISLVFWLILLLRKVNWQTAIYEQRFLLFRGVTLNWILCHALYRFVLLTLPVFDSVQYIFFEPLSLGGTYLLYRLHGRRHPMPVYFGFSDTMIASVIAAFSKFFPSPDHQTLITSIKVNQTFDGTMVGIHLLLLVLIWLSILKNFRENTGKSISIKHS